MHSYFNDMQTFGRQGFCLSAQLHNPTWFSPRCMQCRRGLAMRKLSVCLSVCLSVYQTRGLWQNGRKICPDFYTIGKTILPSFLRRRMVGGGGATPSTWHFESTGPRWSEIADSQPIFARSTSALTPSEKKFNKIGSLYYALSNEPKMIIIRSP